MSENIGEAQLRLTVDLNAFRQSLRDARTLLTNELGNTPAIGSGGRTRGRRTSASTTQPPRRNLGGARESLRALEVAQEKRFRLARRIDTLEERGADVARLRVQLGRLTDTQIRRQFGSFRQVSQELARQVTLEERRLQTQRRQQRAAQQQAALGASLGGARESIDALERAQDRRFRISQRINRLEDRGIDVQRLRTRLGELTTSYAQRQFGTARQISRELEHQVALTEARARRERDLQRTLDRAARTGGPRSPVNGSPLIPGSPRFIAAQRRAEAEALRRSAAAGGPREPLRGRVDLPGSPAFEVAQQRESLRLAREQERVERNRRLEAARAARDRARAQQAEIREGLRIGRLNSSPVTGRLPGGAAIPGSPADRSARARALSKELDSATAELARARRREAKASERRSKAIRGATGNAISSSLIGGAFPALFGQGAGASVGGALGGALGIFGGGFGFAGSLIGTAVGQQADNLGTLSQALQEPIARFQELKDSALLSSRSLEKNIEALINAGRYAEAEAKIREDVAKRGLDAATASRLAAESDELKRSLADLGISIGLVVQGPLTDLINGFNQLLRPGRVAAQSRFIQAGLGEEDLAQYKDRRRDLSGSGLNILDANEQANAEFASKTREAVKAQEQLNTAQTKDNALLSARYRLIDATTQGYERLTLERQKELLIEERNAQLRATPNEGLRIEQETAQRLYEIKQQIRRLDQQRWAESIAAANQLKAIQEEIAIEQQGRNLTSLGRGALQAVAELEAAKRAEQDAQAALRANPGSTDLLNAAQQASANVVLAAEKSKTKLQDAFKSAQDAVKTISRGIEDSVTALRELQNTGGSGLNRFLTPQQQADRQAAVAQQLRPEADALANQLGIRFQTSGTREQINQQLLDFVKAARQELRLGQDITQAQQVDLPRATADLAVVSDALVKVNSQLADATNNLAQKDWAVNVSVNAATGDYAVNLG